jgi:hypothetical protein
MKLLRDLALHLIDLNEAAYTLCQTGACTLPEGFAPAVPIRIGAKIPELLEHDGLPIWGFTTESDGDQYVVFRGTQDNPEWIADLLPLPYARFRGHNVHRGFATSYEAIREELVLARGATITGHSLGSALATLCYAEHGGQLFTFAGPRVGDEGFAASLDGTFRVVNRHDIVPCIPLPPLFHHGGTEIPIVGYGATFDPKLSHALSSYRAGVLAFPK